MSRLLSNGDLLAAAASGILTADEQSLLLTRGKGRRPVTLADQLLIDEANSLLNGPPFTYGHVVVDEAQDHSAVGLRVIGRRSPNGSLTILGDLAQSTTPAGQSDWAVVQRFLNAENATVAHLTIGYRVPAPILDIANRLLPLTQVDTVASRSVRVEGDPPRFVLSTEGSLAVAVVDAVHDVRTHHPLTGVVAPARLHDGITAALAQAGLRAATHVQDLARDEVPLFSPEAVKGLEFDGVVVVNPHEVLDGSARGARLLYVAMTRAVQVLRFVGSEPLPAPLA